jgi:DNA-binding CsgD family transcriptional regulator
LKVIKGRLELKELRVPPLLLGGDTPGGGNGGHDFHRSLSGVLFLDEHRRVVASNAEAIRSLYYPDKPDKEGRRLSALVASKIPMELLRAGVPGSRIAEFLSGRRRYMCTVHSLDVAAGNKAVTAVLLERMSSPEVTLHRICNKYNLTTREREAMGYLLRGRTTKEIAQAMAISPNTVKAFVRSAMTKRGVSTRAGLVGRIAGTRLTDVHGYRGFEDVRGF